MNAQQKTLSVVVPVYYNAESLWKLFERVKKVEQALLTRNTTLELIFVDDGSGDNSFEVLLNIKCQRPATKLVKLTRNFGAITCSNTGFLYATGDCIAVLAADLQDPPEQLLPMYEAWEEGHKLVFSFRRSRKDSWPSKMLAAFFYKLFRIFIIKDFPKGGVDMVLMDKSLLPYIRNLGRGVYYAFYLSFLGFEAKLIPYDREVREHGKSRWTFKKKFFYFLDTITGFTATPLRLVSGIGLGISLLSLAYGVDLIIHAVIKGIEVPGFVTLAVLISFSTSIIVTILSIIGEYIWRIFEITSNHPKSVIEETYLEVSSLKEAK